MSTNCLVTKLKATVENDSLERLGIANLKLLVANGFNSFNASEGAEYIITFPDNVTINTVSGNCVILSEHKAKIGNIGTNTYNGLTLNITGDVYVTIDNRDYYLADVQIENKYNLGYFYGIGELNKFKFIPIMSFESVRECSGRLEDINKQSLKFLVINSVNGSQFSGISNQITGDIASLGDGVLLKQISLLYPNEDQTKVYGTIESFVQKQRALGRTDTSASDDHLSVRFGYTDITFNGNNVGTVMTELYWTASTITLGDNTINA